MTKKSNAGSTSAPGQFYGYGIQEARFLHHLLRSQPGDTVALECIDDVSGTLNGEKYAEQVKSGLAHNPISDRSIDLWKTFANWLNGRRSGKIPAGTKFILYVAQPYRGKIAQRLGDCESKQDAKAAIAEIRKEFWGDAPEFAKRASIPEKLAKQVNVVLRASERALVDIIQAFSLERGIGAPYDEIAAEVAAAPVGAENVEQILHQLAGWIHITIFDLIQKGLPAVVSRDEFHTEYVAVVRKFDRSDTILPTFATPPKAQDLEAELLLDQMYLRQLSLIGAEQDTIYDAMNTFLMAAVDRTEWAKRGYVHRSSFTEYEAALKRIWNSKKTAVRVEMRGKPPEDFGTVLLSSCLEANVLLQGKTVSSHFTPGSFHKLANTLDVGWHPDFAKILKVSGDIVDAA
ncbi:ABC-three component system protein [Paraburkholderia sp. J10-1]|uniref:ABC-three component system protein n=1 Tax=Paraburkholderia sp. J10-1 TaxID=2805430 RepID=UPI002AB66FF8|nr:ABC-three component system protein [Paraburkholderia sp. J10-1]